MFRCYSMRFLFYEVSSDPGLPLGHGPGSVGATHHMGSSCGTQTEEAQSETARLRIRIVPEGKSSAVARVAREGFTSGRWDVAKASKFLLFLGETGREKRTSLRRSPTQVNTPGRLEETADSGIWLERERLKAARTPAKASKSRQADHTTGSHGASGGERKCPFFTFYWYFDSSYCVRFYDWLVQWLLRLQSPEEPLKHTLQP